MDKTAIKNYAVTARKKLMEAVRLKAEQYGIFENASGELSPDKILSELQNAEIFLYEGQKRAVRRLFSELQRNGFPKDKAAYTRLMEDVAYTWFNRLIALRFMEVNGYLPANIRILSSREEGRLEPDALRDADRLDYINPAKIAEIEADDKKNEIAKSEEVYRYILISQCNELSKILPGMFQQIDDYTELLLPDALYNKGGIVHDLVNAIPEDNFKNSVQIIGWLYQFYISEKKDEVFAALKKNVKINKDTIPAATQLFTPEWIVKYMVENSLGRLWLERHPNEKLRAEWKYYIDEAEQEPEVAARLAEMRGASPINSPKEIRVIDPCMGSGHVLVYAFDVLYQIYETEGFHVREIPNLIFTHNLYGLDIDDRAGQLAYFALMMKARSANRRFFRQENVPQPMVHSADGDPELSEYGSLVKVEELGEKPTMPEELHIDSMNEIINHEREVIGWNYRRLLAQKYDVVVTNPPYVAPTPKQADWVKKNYPNSKSDLCVVFIERNFELLKQSGYLSMITMHSFMFLTSYEKFREGLIRTNDIINMAHLGARAFEEIGGEVVQTSAFVVSNARATDYRGSYARLVDFAGQQVKESEFLTGKHLHTAKLEDFAIIPGSPIAYWISELLVSVFAENEVLGAIAEPRQGMATADNNRFLREWFEVSSIKRDVKWFPYSKGGSFRKWYGNGEYYLNWENDGAEIKAFEGSVIRNPTYYFKQGMAWSALTSGNISFRYLPEGYLFDSKGPVCYPKKESDLYSLLGLLNSNSAMHFLKILAPTLDFNQGPISKIPFPKGFQSRAVEDIVLGNIALARTDWDSFETSWDFQKHPLIP